MSDDAERLKIKVELDDAEAKRKLQDQAAAVEKVGTTAKASYKAVGEASDQSATKRVTSSKRASDAETTDLERAAATIKKTAEVSRSSFSAMGADALGLSKHLGAISVAGAGLAVVATVYKSILSSMHEAVVEGQKQVDQLLSLKNNLRDIASMTNSKGGSSDAFVQKHMNIRTASGLDNAGAKAFVQGFAGAGEAKKGVNITEEEYNKAMPLIARYAAANTNGSAADVESFGNLSGLLLGFEKNQTAEGALGSLSNVNEILKQGVGDNPTLIREFSQQAGSLLNADGTGLLKDPKQLAALISTASIQKSAGQSGTVVQQASKALRGFSAKQGGMLADAGITDKDDMITSLYKLFDKMKEAETQGIAPDQFLTAGGLESDEERRSLTALYQGKDYLSSFLDKGRNGMSNKQAMASLDEVYRSSDALQTNIGQAKLEEAQMHNAELKQHIKPLELEARTRLTKRGEGMDSGAAVMEDEFWGNLRSFGGKALPDGMTAKDYGRAMREEQEMYAIMQERGIDVPGRIAPLDPRYEDYIKTGQYQDSYAAATATNYLGKQVGGAPAGTGSAPGRVGNDDNWKKMIDELKKIKEGQDKQTAVLKPKDATPVMAPRGNGTGPWR